MLDQNQIIPTDDEHADQQQSGRPLSPKILALVDRLPEHAWCITRAALAVGYAPNYVDSRLIPRLKRDERFCQAVEVKRQETQRASWDIESWRKMVIEAMEDCRAHGDRTNAKELLRMIAQHIGAFEADNRQRQTQIGMVII